MQKLQQILQRAIAENAAIVELSDQKSPTVWLEAGQTQWDNMGPITGDEILGMLPALFPKDSMQRTMRGQIEIPRFGTLQTIGVRAPSPRLLVFLPQGQMMFDEAWNDVNAQDAAPDLPPVPAPDLSAPLPVMPPPGINIAAPSPDVVMPAANERHPVPNDLGANPQPAPSLAFVPPNVSIADEAPAQVQPAAPASVAAPMAAPVAPPMAPVSEPIAPVPPISMVAPDAPAIAAPIAPLTPPPVAAPIASVAPSMSPAAPSSGPNAIDEILRMMIQRGASDLHMTAGEAVALRIDGEIVRLPELVWDEAQISAMLDPITGEREREQFNQDNDTDFAYEVQGVARFRVNLFRDRHGRGAVLRQIPSVIPSADALGLPDAIRRMCMLNKGLVLVTGPTGSGKSTTLAAMIDLINETRKDHILTLEDPIEFVHKQKNCLVRQREIHRHTTSFSRALRAALREDPDIIMVGELRDLETTALAIEIAETGHLVFGTLHTTTAISTIDRIIDQFPADRQEQVRTMLAESLKGVVSQTLLKKQGGGRAAAQEILVVNGAVSALIRESKVHMLANHMQSQKAEGNILLNEALLNLVKKGVVHPRDAWAKAVDKSNLIERFKSHGIDISWYATLSAA